MPVEIGRHAGFCYGVRRAVEMAFQAAGTGKPCYALGSLTHNKQVMRALRQAGVRVVCHADEIPAGLAIIRSHGEPPGVKEALQARGIDVVDATCSDVHRVHRLVSDYSAGGLPVLIAGKAEHPEIRATSAWCRGVVAVVSDMDEARALPPMERALLVAQTTMPQADFLRIEAIVRERVRDLTVRNTICRASDARQREAAELAKRADVMLVIGDYTSANTRALYDTCRAVCSRTYLLESAADLPVEGIAASDYIAITAGASTPERSLKEVATRMNDLEHNIPQEAGVTQEPIADEETAVIQPDEEMPISPIKEESASADGSGPADEAVMATEPVLAAEPVAAVDPVSEEEPVIAAEPVAVEEPVTVSEPVFAEEPVAVEEPLPATEPAVPVVPVPVEAAEEPTVSVAAETLPIVAEPKTAETGESSFMADIEATLVTIRPGQTITGTVVQITDEEVCVNIGYKSDGIVKRADLVSTDVMVGDEIEVEVVKVNDGEGNVLLSQRNIVNRRIWDALMEKYQNGEYVEGVGKEAVKGGLIANVDGIRAFIPASQLSQRYVEKIEDFVGKDMRLKIIEADKQKRRIVCSRKAVIAEEAAARKQEIWGKLVEGSLVSGIVRRLTDFGAFVDIGGVDGLVHVTDLSWGRVRHPSEVVSPNQEITVKIISLDEARGRIQLGYKQTQPRPWDVAEERYPVGSTIEGKVVRLTTFGAFVEVEPGLDGLVHISQCALTRIDKVEDAVQVGQIVRVKVLGVDTQAKRISLSIRAALEDDAFNYTGDIPGDEMAPAEEADVYATPVDYEQVIADAQAEAAVSVNAETVETDTEEPAPVAEEPETAVEEPETAVEEPAAVIEEPVPEAEESDTAVEEPVSESEASEKA
ncbi:MAG: bifunctional 4-hydroxy-3-methylbut-2-enyl diphosphate reductase/30S ribosomal protein S1 [Clostridia bacterium]|nr:bifunctional 4-hydroxy-3-methylbut-2-enyl diphosphate reductase/30S ribosomal protein S1 [Clostridia bacterium]